MFVQLGRARLSENELEGSLPETWSNLTNVSVLMLPILSVTSMATKLTHRTSLTLLGCTI